MTEHVIGLSPSQSTLGVRRPADGTGAARHDALAGPNGFAGTLRALRDDARLTQEDLARRSGVSVRTIRNLELGRTARPYHETVELLARGLGLGGSAAQRLRASARPSRAESPLPDRNGASPGGRARGGVPPRQLPADARHFFGRETELGLLTALCTNQVSRGTALVVNLSGPAGVGKTGLAVHWAHLVKDRFPDGQLYCDLRRDDGDPVCPEEVLPGLLRALGVTEEVSPARVREQAALYRTLIAERRVLVVLDNATGASQVRPLLPATSRCPVLVTSRHPIPGLVAGYGAARMSLTPLPPLHAVRLLQALIGARVTADPAAAHELAVRCRRLPRALRVAAELVVSHPGLPLRSLLDGTDRTHGRLLPVGQACAVPFEAPDPVPASPASGWTTTDI